MSILDDMPQPSEEELEQFEDVSLFNMDGVTFEVVAKVRAVREDGKRIDTVAGPILLIETDSLYGAMFQMALACAVPEYQAEPDELFEAAGQIVNEIKADKFNWVKPKERK